MAEQMMQEAAGKAIPAGYKQTDAGVIPEDWEQVALGNIAEVRMCKRIFSDQTTESGAIPFFKIGTFGGQPDAYISISRYNEFKAKYSFPEKGDVLISAAGTLGKTVVYDGAPAYFQDSNIVWLEVNKNKILNEYLRHYYKVISWASPEGSTISRLYNAIIRATVINLPSLPEQTAIANVLSDSDALIDALEQLIAKKQAIKTATMQQLLTGRTRLPAFALRPDGTPKGYKPSELGHIPEDWHEVSLSSVTKNIDAGVSVNSIDQLDAYGHGKHVLKTSCVNGGVFNCLEAKSIIPSDIGRAKCFPREGNIIVSRMNTPALVGEIGYIEKSLPGYFLPDRLWQVSFREDAELNTKWLMYVLAHPINAKKIKESATGTSNSMKNISKNAFLALKIYKPKIEEQTAIATILTDMDSELTALEQKLAKARDVKQGMMQQLLTGRIRLPVEQVE